MLVLQLYVFGSAYDQLPPLGANAENTGCLRQKRLSGVEKAEGDFFSCCFCRKDCNSVPCQLKPCIKATPGNTGAFGMIFCPLLHSDVLLNIVSLHTHPHASVHFVIKCKSQKQVPEQRGGDGKDREVGD